MKREEFIQWLHKKGYKDERGWGRYRKESNNGRVYAFKVSKIAARYEAQVVYPKSKYSPRSVSWIRLASGYFKDLSINEKDQISGMKR